MDDVNDDDDDGNGTPDKDDPNVLNGDDDLVALSLSVSPTTNWPNCKVQLTVVGDNKDCIKIWNDPNKQELVIPDGSYYWKKWNPGDLPGTLWVEGITSTPAGADVLVSLKYKPYPWDEVYQSDNFSVEMDVLDVDITNLQTSPYLPGTDNPSDSYSMGEDVIIDYQISAPYDFTPDSSVLTVRDKNGTLVYSDSSISGVNGIHTATWSVSTESLRSVNSNKSPYDVKITITKGDWSCSDSVQMDVIASTVSVVAEYSATAGGQLTECMEGRWVTFTATASGFVSTIPGNDIDFTFFFKKADGTVWSETDWSFDLVEDHIAVADDVLDGDSDHYFDTPIHVTAQDNFTHFATSNYIWIRVWELWIEYFRDDATGKDWKVVVNKDIAYSAIASPDCTNWDWDMPEGIPDMWNPTGGNQRTGNAMVIPNSDLPSASDWDHFGDTYGKVKVFCEDEEGNNHTFYSTSMDPSKKAEVFFELHATTNPGGTNPNWYYYWSEALGVTGDHTYNGALPISQTIVTSATTWTIEIGQNAHWSTMGNQPTGQMYINGFWATNLHENWHKDHRVHNFSVHGSHGAPPNFLPIGVDPDQDGICTPWENTIGTNPNVPNSTEDGANWAEQNGVYNHQDKDWACPGSQW